MKLTRRSFGQAALGTMGAAALPGRLRAQENVHRSHGTSLIHETLKYPADFAHFDYVNPDAPKGGLIRIDSVGQFDSFNPFIAKGTPPGGIGVFIFDSLTTLSIDEGGTEYGLLAEWIEYPDDQSWVSFKLRDDARWHDGEPVTVEDVIFSLDILKTKGAPSYAGYYANVTGAEDLGGNVVRFNFDQAGNRELPHIVGQLSILPKHWWATRDFAESGLEPLLGSGPYRIGDYETNRYVEYVRVEDYWGKDLPVNVGAFNFDRIRIDFYLDPGATFDAFRAGQVDYRDENSAIIWAENYNFPAVKQGRVKKEEVTFEGPKAVQSFFPNLRREKFKDRRVRKALELAFDFEWARETVFFGQYARPRSYFQGTEDLMPDGPPDEAELVFLEPLRDMVPEEVFGPHYEPPVTDGSGRNRRNLREAAQLLDEAGWTVQGNTRVNAAGEALTLEFLSASEPQGRIILPYLKNLERIGVKGDFRLVDPPQYIERVFTSGDFDFDMIIYSVGNSESPGNEQRYFWGSDYAGQARTRNLAGVADPAVDTLIEQLVQTKDRESLSACCRALDRVLTWNHYTNFELFTPFDRIAYWDRFGIPDPRSPRDTVPTWKHWWFDAAKDAALKEGG